MQLLVQYFSFSDVRSKREYDESHVITARLVKKVYGQSQNLGLPYRKMGRMGDCVRGPGGSTYYWTLWAAETGLPLCVHYEGLLHCFTLLKVSPLPPTVNSFIKQMLL